MVPSPTQPAITCSKLTIETLKQGVKYVQRVHLDHLIQKVQNLRSLGSNLAHGMS